MKFNINKLFITTAVLFAISSSGCKKFLAEDNPTGAVDAAYYKTLSGFEALVLSNYAPLRTITGYNSLYCYGTDIFSSYGTTDVTDKNLYNGSYTKFDGDVYGFWQTAYNSINISNNVVYWAGQDSGIVPVATLKIRVGEAKTLRAYYYYLLAESFSGVPLKLTPTTATAYSFPRETEENVYKQIIQDLTDAIALLPTTSADFGRITKGVAQHLLAKAYLARGYKTFGGGAADFALAASTAEALINSGTYSLVGTWSNLFDPTINGFEKNPEIILSAQYSTSSNNNTNSRNQNFLWDTQSIPAIGRSSLYGKPNYGAVPTPYFLSLFDKTRDARYLGTVWNAIICQTATAATSTTPAFAVGDTVVYYPNVAWTAAQKAAVKYYVFNPDEYRKGLLTLSRSFPLFKKFREPSLGFQDGGGSRDSYIFRLAETYLIAAEAYLKAGNTIKALQFYNAVRKRAALPGNNPLTGVAYSTEIQVASLTINDIMDERARELVGEEFRWLELKRTGTLVARAIAYNDELKAVNTTIDSHFLLRPIPGLDELVSGGSIAQNPGW